MGIVSSNSRDIRRKSERGPAGPAVGELVHLPAKNRLHTPSPANRATGSTAMVRADINREGATMEKVEFLPIRKKLWDRLSERDKLVAEDECILSRLFWEYGFVENSLRYPAKPWAADGLTAIQRRILISAAYNRTVEGVSV